MPSESESTSAGLQRWLTRQALLASPLSLVASGFADGLIALGVPLLRAHLSMSTLHPQVESVGLTWTRDGQRLREEYGHGSFAQLANNSPIYDAIRAAQASARTSVDENARNLVPMTRHRLERGEGTNAYPVLGEFRAAGATDYLCFVMPFATDGKLGALDSGAVVSMTTDRPGGFADAEIAVIADLMPAFGVAVRAGADLAVMRTLLETYLGKDVGRRVLSGEIQRGSVEAISAAIVVGDLRGFTAMADRAPRDSLVTMLNDYLDCLIGPIEASGGQVLKLLGDGLLATFAFAAGNPSTICADALSAASDALRRVEALNRRRHADGAPVMTVDIALHAGEVLYGNVGSERRLDFTVIGPAVNEASRLESLCGTLEVPLVASRRFVDLLGAPGRFRSLGAHALRGVRTPVEVFALLTEPVEP